MTTRTTIPLTVPDLRGNESAWLERCLTQNGVSSAGPEVQAPYLHPRRSRVPGPAIDVDNDPLPDVVLEVDHTTDVRRRRLGMP